MPNPAKNQAKTGKNVEIFTFSKPADWSDEEWDAMSPEQRARYALNPQLYRPGRKAQSSATMSGEEALTPPAGLPAAQGQGKAPAESGKVQTPAFEVVEASSVAEAIEVNGLALIQDAYRRAARAADSGDPFDRMVYGILLGKAHPMAMLGKGSKALSKETKARKKMLEALLAAHAAGQGVQDAAFTPVDTADRVAEAGA